MEEVPSVHAHWRPLTSLFATKAFSSVSEVIPHMRPRDVMLKNSGAHSQSAAVAYTNCIRSHKL